MLRCFSDESGGNWNKFLQRVVDAYNTMAHPATGTSPFVAMYKWENTSDIFSMPSIRDVLAPTEFEQLREWIKSYIAEVNAKTDAKNNVSRMVKRAFVIGDLVWAKDHALLKRAEGGPGKLARQWCGPWTVSATWGNVVLTLKRVGSSETKLAHVDQCKRFIFSSETPRELLRKREPKRPSTKEQSDILRRISKSSDREGNELDTDADAEEQDLMDDTAYEVEKVLGHFYTPQGFWFLVSFVGFSEPSWEHESLLEASKLVTDYFKRVCEDA